MVNKETLLFQICRVQKEQASISFQPFLSANDLKRDLLVFRTGFTSEQCVLKRIHVIQSFIRQDDN